jgi:hypothetical protein
MRKWIMIAFVAAIVVYGFCGCGGEPFVTSYGLVDPPTESGEAAEAQVVVPREGGEASAPAPDAAPDALGGQDAGMGHDAADEILVESSLVEAEASLPEAAPCYPQDCAEQGAVCGAIPDGCGGTYECGPCLSAGTPNCHVTTCETAPCTPSSCGDRCGSQSDGCGNVLTCAACP